MARASARRSFSTEETPTRERILETALDVFAEYGFDGTSTREICKRAGVNVAALNYHWGSKENLWLATCEVITRRVMDVTRECFDPALPVEAMVPKFLGALFDYLRGDPRPVRIGLWASLQAESMDFPTVFETFEPFVRMGVDYFEMQRAAGRIRDLDVEVLLTTFYGQFVQAFLDQPGQRLLFGKDFSDAAHAERVKRTLIQSAMILLGLDEKQGAS